MLWDRQALEQELDRMDGTIGGHGLVDELLSDDSLPCCQKSISIP